MPRSVSVDCGTERYAQTVSVGSHVFQSDEPADVGGKDTGPNPHELLMGSLGACVNITVQMYAERHQLPLKGVRSALSYSRALAENGPDSESAVGMVDQIDMEISFTGNLSGEQQQRLLDIAHHCPIHRMLISHVVINTTLLASTSHAA